jgi:hypothetical protein
VTISGFANGSYAQIFLRASTTAKTWYVVQAAQGSTGLNFISEVANGTPTYFGSATITPLSIGNQFCAGIQDYTLYAIVNGTVIATATDTSASIATGDPGIGVYDVVAATDVQYSVWQGFNNFVGHYVPPPRTCQTGLGDGLNAIPSGTYLQTFCYNDSGVPWTITGIKCFTDNSGSSTLAATDSSANALLTGAITCSSSFAAGTQSAHVTIPSGGYIKFTFAADGASTQTAWVVTLQ